MSPKTAAEGATTLTPKTTKKITTTVSKSTIANNKKRSAKKTVKSTNFVKGKSTKLPHSSMATKSTTQSSETYPSTNAKGEAKAEAAVEAEAEETTKAISATTAVKVGIADVDIDGHVDATVKTKIEAMIAAVTSTSSARFSTMREGILGNYHYVTAILALLFLLCGLAGVDARLKCHMCGQYNEGVGSITPCLNYSEQIAHLYLKDCGKSSEKFCVKYVSGLSTVRDCATECTEKEVWETQTYCCNTDGCNGAGNMEGSLTVLIVPMLYFIYRAVKSSLKAQQ